MDIRINCMSLWPCLQCTSYINNSAIKKKKIAIINKFIKKWATEHREIIWNLGTGIYVAVERRKSLSLSLSPPTLIGIHHPLYWPSLLAITFEKKSDLTP